MLVDQPDGNYRFIKSSGPFSTGSLAQPGYEVVHATFHPLPALEKGYDLIAAHLQKIGRPMQALCGMELRIPSHSRLKDLPSLMSLTFSAWQTGEYS